MKKNLVSLFLLSFILKTSAQNIVLNPDFEQFSSCPTVNGDLQKANNWLDVVYSADYMNCAYQGWTTQAVTGAQNGLGYAGFATYGNSNGAAESFGQFLSTPIVAGNSYRINFYAKRSDSGFYSSVCSGVCFYGFSGNPAAGGAQTNICTDQLVGATLLGCSDTIVDVNWQPFTIDFMSPANLDFIVITPGCALNCAEYIYIDNIYFSQTIPVALFTSPNHICPGTCTNFTNLSQNATTYLWTFAGANPSTSVDASPTNICYNTPGNYPVSLIATNSITSDTLTLNNYITVYPYPPPQGIMQNGDTLIANQGAVSYLWYYSGNSIPGATDYFYLATQSGDYNVVATDANGCEVEAAIFDVVAEIQSEIGNGQFAIYPNPVVDKCTIYNSQLTMGAVAIITIYNMLGVALQSEIKNQKSEMIADVTELPSGIYWLEVSTRQKILRSKFIKQ